MTARRTAPALAWLITALAAAPWMVSCSDPPKAKRVTPIVRDTPQLLRGTIGTEVDFHGIEPVLVSGLGLVVGLNGTGGETLPDNISATMEREMGLNGVGKAGNYQGTAIEGKTPRELLRDKNVAVVIVQAAIPPGAPANAQFDVYVRALNASSLEGGTLWTTDLRLGQANTFGSVQARQIGVANGPIFINPFADLGKEAAGVTVTTGRVLDGGRVTNPMGIEMVMANSSFARARAIVSAINSRFPSMAGDPVTTARGRSGPDLKSGVGGSIELHVPNRYRQNPSDFLNLVKHLQIDQGFPEQYSRRYVEGLKSDPALGEDLSWCLESVGAKSLPFARELYDYPELVPRLAALKAGARLNDPYAASALKDVAMHAHGGVRTQAISFLGQIDAGLTVDNALHELLAEKELDVRVAAYEALAKRAERSQLTRFEDYIQSNPDAPRPSPTHLQVLASRTFSAQNIQGIERIPIEDKFLLDIVPGGEPMIYITQQGQPRVVLFGNPPAAGSDLIRPMVVTAWSDRLMMSTEETGNTVRVYYRPAKAERPSIQTVKASLPTIIEFMARKHNPDDPRPGLDMSYSEIVGALYALQHGRGTYATFATETDRLLAQVNGARTSREIAERPESAEDREIVVLQPRTPDQEAPKKDNTGPHIVPITPPTDTKKK